MTPTDPYDGLHEYDDDQCDCTCGAPDWCCCHPEDDSIPWWQIAVLVTLLVFAPLWVGWAWHGLHALIGG